MNKFTKIELNNFKQLFQIVPNIEILDFNSSLKDITLTLNQLVQDDFGTITSLDTNDLQQIQPKLKKSNYDYVVISNFFTQINSSKILFNILSQSLRDSGYIIIIESKDTILQDIYETFEQYNFGSISKVDIFEKHNLLIAQKVHMWGM